MMTVKVNACFDAESRVGVPDLDGHGGSTPASHFFELPEQPCSVHKPSRKWSPSIFFFEEKEMFFCFFSLTSLLCRRQEVSNSRHNATPPTGESSTVSSTFLTPKRYAKSSFCWSRAVEPREHATPYLLMDWSGLKLASELLRSLCMRAN